MKKFDYWMLSEIDQALQKEYDLLCRTGKYGRILRQVARDHGVEKAKELQDDYDANQFHPLGKIALTRKRIQEMKDEYAAAMKY